MSQEILLANGKLYDPKNRINGENMDICVRDGKIVEKVSTHAKKIDLKGMVVMPGGVDIHTHITGSKMNAGRIMRPEDVRRKGTPRGEKRRCATGDTVPNVYQIGYTYARMGYTTVVEGAVPPLKAKHTHEELASIPILDKAAMILTGNNWLIMNYLADQEMDLAAEYVKWLLESTKGYGLKLVNPGGTEAWGWGKNVHGLHDKVPRFDITPSEIIKGLERINEELTLPTSIHLHTNRLGVPGNYSTTLDTMDLASGHQSSTTRDQVMHLVHLQFHSYGGDSWRNFSSMARDVAKSLNRRENVTADAGAVIFGWATTMTADAPFEYDLQRLTHAKWTNADVEAETGAGIVPHFYSRKNAVSTVQWCTGLELLLTAKPEKLFLSTDSPNAGPFYRYPHLIRLLMDSKYRENALSRSHKVAKKSALPSMDREFDLYQIATITRSQTAKALGLENKGHLGPGADADIAVYDIQPGVKKGIQKRLENAALVVKSGNIVVKEGKIVDTPPGTTYWTKCRPGNLKPKMLAQLENHFNLYSVQMNNYRVTKEQMGSNSPLTPGVEN